MTKENKIISDALQEIRAFELRDSSEFKNCFSQDTILDAQGKEYRALLSESQVLNYQYDIIFNEMKKVIR